MIEVLDVMLLRPQWLLALPVIALLGYYLMPRMTALAGWERAVDPDLMQALERLGRVVPGSGRRNWFPAATALLIAVALIGPAKQVSEGGSFRNLDGVILVMDLSRSVAEGGHLETSLTAARLAVEQAGTRPVALIVYGGDAYLASAFTSDHRALGTTIAILDGETVPDIGSRPARGLEAARRSLSDADIIVGDVLLVSDGGGIDDAAFREAAAIAARGSRLSGLFVPASAEVAEMPPPDRAKFEDLVRSGGGLVADVRDPLAVSGVMAQSTSTQLAAGDLVTLVWQDYGRFLLFFALLPALALFRKGG